MKKYIKILLAVFIIVAGVLRYKFVIFNDEPFDRLRAGRIERADIETSLESGTYPLTNPAQLPDVLDDLELESRVIIPNKNKTTGKVTLHLYMDDGNESFIIVDSTYIQTEKGTYKGDREGNIELLEYAFRQTLFDQNLLPKGDRQRINEMVSMAVNGKTWEEIRDYAKQTLLDSGYPEDHLKTFANMGYSPISIYILDDTDRAELRNNIITSAQQSGKELTYEGMAEQTWIDYKNGTIVYSDRYSKIPDDFIFTDMIDWDKHNFVQNEMGYYYVKIPSADGKYYMVVTIDDTYYGNIDGTVDYYGVSVKNTSFSLQSDFK